MHLYAIGDQGFVVQILNGVASIVGTGDFIGLISTGMLIGIIVVCVKAIGSQQLELNNVFMALLVYLIAFVPKVDVSVIDPYDTGSTPPVTVANVPIGMAAAGMASSTIGVKITELMENGFAVITPVGSYSGMLESGYMGDIRVLMNLREIMSPPGNASYVAQNIAQYAKDCTYKQIQENPGIVQQIRTDQDPLARMVHPHNAQTTIYLDNAGAQSTVSCADGHTRITNDVNSQTYQTAFFDHTAKISNYEGTAPFPDYIAGVLRQLGAAGADSFRFAHNALVAEMYRAGVSAAYTAADVASAEILTNALNARNTDAASEASLFVRIMRSLMTFVEGMVYSTVPLMGFLIITGVIGMKAAGKYLLMLAWINMWMPILAVIRLYTWNILSGEMAALSTAPALSIESIEGRNIYLQEVMNWYGTASMLAASVPVITSGLIYGGAVSLGALAGRLNAAASSAADYDGRSVTGRKGQFGVGNVLYSTDGLTGAGTTSQGATAMPGYGGIQLGAGQSAALENIRADQQALASSASREIGALLANGRTATSTDAYKTSSVRGTAFSEGNSLGEIYNTVGNFTQGTGQTLSSTAQKLLTETFSINASAGFEKFGTGVSFKTVADSVSRRDESLRDEMNAAVSELEQISSSEAFQKNYNESMSRQDSQDHTEALADQVAETDQASYKRALTSTRTANEALSDRVAQTQAINAGAEIQIQDVVQNGAHSWAQDAAANGNQRVQTILANTEAGTHQQERALQTEMARQLVRARDEQDFQALTGLVEHATGKGNHQIDAFHGSMERLNASIEAQQGQRLDHRPAGVDQDTVTALETQVNNETPGPENTIADVKADDPSFAHKGPQYSRQQLGNQYDSESPMQTQAVAKNEQRRDDWINRQIEKAETRLNDRNVNLNSAEQIEQIFGRGGESAAQSYELYKDQSENINNAQAVHALSRSGALGDGGERANKIDEDMQGGWFGIGAGLQEGRYSDENVNSTAGGPANAALVAELASRLDAAGDNTLARQEAIEAFLEEKGFDVNGVSGQDNQSFSTAYREATSSFQDEISRIAGNTMRENGTGPTLNELQQEYTNLTDAQRSSEAGQRLDAAIADLNFWTTNTSSFRTGNYDTAYAAALEARAELAGSGSLAEAQHAIHETLVDIAQDPTKRDDLYTTDYIENLRTLQQRWDDSRDVDTTVSQTDTVPRRGA